MRDRSLYGTDIPDPTVGDYPGDNDHVEFNHFPTHLQPASPKFLAASFIAIYVMAVFVAGRRPRLTAIFLVAVSIAAGAAVGVALLW